MAVIVRQAVRWLILLACPLAAACGTVQPQPLPTVELSVPSLPKSRCEWLEPYHEHEAHRPGMWTCSSCHSDDVPRLTAK